MFYFFYSAHGITFVSYTIYTNAVVTNLIYKGRGV